MVLCSDVHSTVLRTFEPSDDDSDLISTMNGSRSLVVEMRSKPSDAQSDGSDAVHFTT
ncbi:hypothetical protein RHMOL_Rhmol04G0226700 [Rhododendron molle]|uniref:Uncharacterized protein n=1 Tax=Rhododendron molle TaxID=49168 RepID=A0ACC0P510_RHOML|nr:hypothetical protein RHMOL_Rhmol04G0226700 [Rhododendron molle]